MSCCGQKRAVYQPVTKTTPGIPENAAPPKMWSDPRFEYTGETALTVTGSITGRRYRFAAPGDTQVIDYRDAGPMMAIPVLKKLT